MAESRGDIVAVTESRMEPAGDWCRTLTAAHARWPEADVIGGAVAVKPAASPRQVGLYLAEYAPYAPPLADEAVSSVSAANVSYKRRAVREPPSPGQWDAMLHHARAGGPVLRSSPATVVFQDGFGLGEAIAMRFHYARAFAGERPLPGIAHRLLHAAGSFALPVVLARRMAALPARSGRPAASGAAAIWAGVFLMAWAAGEGIGYIAGPGSETRMY